MNKVVVIAPSELDDLFEILSFHKVLNQYLEIIDFTMIIEKTNFRLLEFLVKGSRIIERTSNDFGILESIRYANKLKEVFNTTHVFNFDNSLGSISFSKALRPTYCYGIKSQLSNLFYTKEFTQGPLVEILDYILEEKVERGLFFEEVDAHLAENFFNENSAEPFLLIAVNELSKSKLITHLIKALKGKRIILWCATKNDLYDQFISMHEGLIDASEVGEELLYKYVGSAFGVITDRPDIARLSNYYLKENFLLKSSEALKPNVLMVNKTVSIIDKNDFYVLDYSNGESEKKDNNDEVISIILSLLND